MTLLRSPIRSPLRSFVYSPLLGKWATTAQRVAALFAGDDWAYYDPSNLSSTWEETTPITPARDVGDVIGLIQDYTGNYEATQATNKPTRQAGNVVRFDGTDDYLATDHQSGAANNTMAVKITAPLSVSGLDVIMGNADGVRWYLSINASGIICGGVGNHGAGVVLGSTDIRGLTGTAALVENGTTVKLYWESVEEYSGGQSGNPPTGLDIYLGAFNSAGSPSTYFGGDIHYAITAQAEKSAAEIAQLTNLWG